MNVWNTSHTDFTTTAYVITVLFTLTKQCSPLRNVINDLHTGRSLCLRTPGINLLCHSPGKCTSPSELKQDMLSSYLVVDVILDGVRIDLMLACHTCCRGKGPCKQLLL